MNQPAELVGVADVARILGVSRSTVKRLAQNGKLPYAVKLPGVTGVYLFDLAAVARFAAGLGAA